MKNTSISFAAEKLFVTQSVLKLVPKPRNETIDDLKAHVRNVLFGSDKGAGI